jgi:hypothetical protein
VRDRAERVQIGPPARRTVGEKLGGQVRERPHRSARFRALRKRQAEIDDHQPAAELGRIADEQVGRLQVPMEEIELVKERQSAERLDDELDEKTGAFVAHGLDDVAPFDELEREPREARAG